MERQYIAIRKRNWEAIIGTICFTAITFFLIFRALSIDFMTDLERFFLYTILAFISFGVSCFLAAISSKERYERYYVRKEGR
jgi:hypothetical protein